MAGFETILYTKEEGIAQIALNRPQVLNAHSIQMRDEMHEALEAMRDDPDVRCILLRGEGDRAFCVGADLTEFGTAPSRVIARQVRWERDMWGLLLSIDKPIVAAVHGYVVGSGVEMALLCDLRIASEDAIFQMPEVGLGMIPIAGGTLMLPRILGIPGALDMLLSGGRIDAARAFEVGLVHEVVPRDRLLEEAFALAKRLSSFPAHVTKAMKQAIRRGMDLPLEQALDLEMHLATSVIATG